MSSFNTRSIVNFVAVNGDSNVDVVVVARELHSASLAKRKPCHKAASKCAKSIARICMATSHGMGAAGRAHEGGLQMPVTRGQWPATQTLRRLERIG
jgi:hypothetical protein